MSKRSVEEVCIVPPASAAPEGRGGTPTPSKLTKYDEALYLALYQAREKEKEKQARRIQQYVKPLTLPTPEESEAIVQDIQKTIIECANPDSCEFELFEDNRAAYGLRMIDYLAYEPSPWITTLKRFVDGFNDADIEPSDRFEVRQYVEDQVDRYLEHICDAWRALYNAARIEKTERGFIVMY